MNITKAQFVKSSAKLAGCPAPDRHEYAFIGRSNVGKSSLINMLTNNKGLAKTAARPGKTQLINHFDINDSWYLVDLPGYGYARTSKDTRSTFESMIQNYILHRDNLICLFVLIDSRHTPQRIDMEFMEWLANNQIPFVMVFTKADKLSTSEMSTCVQSYQKEMLKTWESTPIAFLSSAEKRYGKDEILDYIEELNNTVKL